MKNFVESKEKVYVEKKLKYDVAVVGGGVSGLSAAMAAARHGAKVALIQDRGVLGGNASSECRMHISGASCHWGKKDAVETGILYEMMLENKAINDSYNFSLWDSVMWDAATNQKGLDLYLNTTMHAVDASDGKIDAIHCYRMSTEEHLYITADIYMDCTGHGTLGAAAGAEFRIGCEARDEYGEPDAPEVRNGNTMGNTIYFVAENMGHPVKFHKPSWAYDFTEDDFKHRYHGDIVVYHSADDVVILPSDADYEDITELVEKYDVESGYWWVEIGGDWDDIIGQAEDIRDELIKIVYGVWNHIKNSPGHGAENYELIWVGSVPGIRESRRLMGDYVLSQKDIYGNVYHSDGVAYGGWPMDEHTPGGFRAKGMIPSRVISFDGFYTIPYGCFCSRNISNLMMAGRNLSATKLGLSSTRVMGTCAVCGQAAGTAAALAVAHGCSPRGMNAHVTELRQTLLRDDCFIPGCRNEDGADMARSAAVSASSYREGYEPELILSGVTRRFEGSSNLWRSNGMSPDGEKLTLKLEKAAPINQVRLTFDPNLCEEKFITVSRAIKDKEIVGVAPELVRDYSLIFTLEGKVVRTESYRGNYHRHVVHDIPATLADSVTLLVSATNGDADARVYEIRIY